MHDPNSNLNTAPGDAVAADPAPSNGLPSEDGAGKVSDPNDFENATNVYGAWDDDRLGEMISEYNDCLPGVDHVYVGACGDVRCQYCGRKFTP